MTSDAPLPVDPRSLIRSRQYRVLLVLASVIGLVVSVASWGFLELVHAIQVGVYEDLPGDARLRHRCRAGGRCRGLRSPAR